MSRDVLLELREVRKDYPVGRSLFGDKQLLHAVAGVSFQVFPGETLALVGESGCGKSTTGRLILNLEKLNGGEILFKGRSTASYNAEDWQEYRRNVQVVFQDSHSSLNPRKTLRHILVSAMLCSQRFSDSLTGRERRELAEKEALSLLRSVGLTPPEQFLEKYPNELSGGQRQRIGIARALSTQPDLIVADEPVSSLDVSVKAQVLKLLETLRDEKEVAFLFVSHELPVVRSIAHRVAVMYLGKIVEIGEVADVFSRRLHPYTEALISASPVPDPEATRKKKRIVLPGGVPSAIDPPKGCPFHPRCFHAQDICRTEAPPLREEASGHHVACHFAAERLQKLTVAQ